MDTELYLLWSPQRWGVFSQSTCPDPVALPPHWYKKYVVPEEKRQTAFNRLMGVKDKLEADGIVPTKEIYKEIFPDISSLL